MATTSILLSTAAASDAAADSKVRFLHAVPGAPEATLTVSGGDGPKATLANVGFAKPSAATNGPSGPVTIALAVKGKTLATQKATLADGGSYTVVAEKKGSGPALRFETYRSARAVPGAAEVRAVHAAPEVGRVRMTLGSKTWGTIGYGQDTGYKRATPGTYTFAARSLQNGSPLVQAGGVNAAAGSAATAYVVGSSGARTRVVLVADSTAAPSGGPHTGLGGLAPGNGGTPWLAALLAALGAGGVGALLYTRGPQLRRGRART